MFLFKLIFFGEPSSTKLMLLTPGPKRPLKIYSKIFKGDFKKVSKIHPKPSSFRSFPFLRSSNQQVHPDLYRNELHAMSTMAMFFLFSELIAFGGDQGCFLSEIGNIEMVEQ